MSEDGDIFISQIRDQNGIWKYHRIGDRYIQKYIHTHIKNGNKSLIELSSYNS